MRHSVRSNTSVGDALTSFTKPAVVTAPPPFPEPKSKVFGAVLRSVERFAAYDSVVILFEGESGTGKNWLARLAHQRSRRAAREFRVKSLADIADPLAESELFGHEAGAFTDARHRRAGLFQSANHGTLLIDELGKASPSVQRLLLSAVEEGEICPVGSDRSVKIDVRLLLATNVSLESLVAQGRFLPDLFARLGQFRILLPPLRERSEDIPDLARFFLARHALKCGYPVGLPTIHPELMDAFVRADWINNLRELDASLFRLVVEANSEAQLTLAHCVDKLEYLRGRSRGRPTKSSPASVAAAVSRSKSITGAANELGVSRSTIYRKLARGDDTPPPPPVAD